MPIYEKTVLEALRKGPKTRNELFREICPKLMSKKKLQKTLNELEDEGRVINVPKRIGQTHKWTSCYASREHRHLLEVDLGRVIRTVKHLRLELCRNPDVEEVAAKVGAEPENIQKLLFIHAPKLRWKPPTPEDKDEAKKASQKVLELAAEIKYSLESRIELSEISKENIERIEFLIKHNFDSIQQEHIPIRGVVLGPGFGTPALPKERKKEEAIKTVRKLSDLKEAKYGKVMQ